MTETAQGPSCTFMPGRPYLAPQVLRRQVTDPF